MRPWSRWSVFLLLCLGVCLPVSLRAQSSDEKQPDQKQSDQKPSKKDQKAKQKSQRELFNELDSPYKKWLDEDVAYIITDDERRSFLQLQTNEEREQFIEAFWQRRNPDPDSVENEAKEEHYRRIAYANEHYASGVPGWKTDRGRIYIEYGKPDELQAHTQGETWERPDYLGGGETETYAYEDWTYNYIEGVGSDVEIEFVDPSGTGEFHYTTNESEKDAFTYIPGAGDTMAEDMGQSSRVARVRNTDGTTNPAPLAGTQTPQNKEEFTKLDTTAHLFSPPAVKFKDLEAQVTSRIVRDQIHFNYRPDFLRVTDDTVLVPVTVQIPNRQMSFLEKNGVQSATLDLFGRVSTLTGRIVQTFEDTIRNDVPDSLLQQSLASSSIYQKAVPLRPGLYRLDLVLKDTSNNNVGVVNARLAVPEFPDDKLAASTLILADEMSPVSGRDIGVGQFVIGSTKVRPKLDRTFRNDQPVGVFFQLYNLKMDDATHKNNAKVEIHIFQGDKSVADVTQTSADIHQTGEEMTVMQALSFQGMAPGKYRLDVLATDEVSNQTLTLSTEFTVTPDAAPQNSATQAPVVKEDPETKTPAGR